MDGPGTPPVAIHPDLADIYQVELVSESARIPQSGRSAGRQSESDMALGAGRDGTRRSHGCSREGSGRLDQRRASIAIDATVNKENLLQRIHTWVAHPVLGDMNYEHEFTNESYIDHRERHQVSNRLAFPSGLGRQLRRAGRERRPQRVRRSAAEGVRQRLRGSSRRARISADRNVPGPRRILDGSPMACICSAAHRTTASSSSSRTTSPCSKRRSTKRAIWPSLTRSSGSIPNKPIRFVVNSHQHFDHAGGLRAYPAHRRHDHHALEELGLLQPATFSTTHRGR